MDEMKKYIIEFSEDPHTIRLMKIKNGDKFPTTEFKTVSPYTESDIEKIRKEAYDEGYQEGMQLSIDDAKLKEAYQQGLNDAWDAARKISMAEINGRCSWKSMKNIFGYDIPSKIFKNFTASEAIESLKIYEQKHDGEIKIGDEVDAPEMKPFIVTGFGYGDDEMDVYCHGITTGEGIPTSAKKMFCVRTGRYFPEIAAILAKMKES